MTRLRTHCAARPARISGRSNARHAAPRANISTNTSPPIAAARSSPGSTGAPPITAGTASSGSAHSVPNTISDDAVMPEAAAAAGTPARTSIAYCMAPEAATPPGTTRPKAFEASWDVITGPHGRVRSATRWTHHMQP